MGVGAVFEAGGVEAVAVLVVVLAGVSVGVLCMNP